MYIKPKIKILRIRFQDIITQSEPPCSEADACGGHDDIPEETDPYGLNNSGSIYTNGTI